MALTGAVCGSQTHQGEHHEYLSRNYRRVCTGCTHRCLHRLRLDRLKDGSSLDMANRNEPKAPDGLQPIDYVMSMLENALYSGLTLHDVVELGCFAQSIKDLDAAVAMFPVYREDEVLRVVAV